MKLQSKLKQNETEIVPDKIEVVDEKQSIFRLTGKEEQEYGTIAEIRQMNLINRKAAKSIRQRVDLMVEEIDEAIALADSIPHKALVLRHEVSLMLGARGGRRTNEIIDSRCHAKLSKALAIVLREDKKMGFLKHKKVPYVVIGKEYVAPHKDPNDLIKKFREKKGLKNEEKN